MRSGRQAATGFTEEPACQQQSPESLVFAKRAAQKIELTQKGKEEHESITMQLVADKYIKMALEEDINSEDVSTNAVMPEYKKGDVQLICKEDGIIAGLQIFERVFTLLMKRRRWSSS